MQEKKKKKVPVQVLFQQNSIHCLEQTISGQVHRVQRKKDQKGSQK